MTDQDWTVPLCYTRTELADFIEAVKAGRSGRLVFAHRSEGGDTYAIAKSDGARNLWFNGLRVETTRSTRETWRRSCSLGPSARRASTCPTPDLPHTKGPAPTPGSGPSPFHSRSVTAPTTPLHTPLTSDNVPHLMKHRTKGGT